MYFNNKNVVYHIVEHHYMWYAPTNPSTLGPVGRWALLTLASTCDVCYCFLVRQQHVVLFTSFIHRNKCTLCLCMYYVVCLCVYVYMYVLYTGGLQQTHYWKYCNLSADNTPRDESSQTRSSLTCSVINPHAHAHTHTSCSHSAVWIDCGPPAALPAAKSEGTIKFQHAFAAPPWPRKCLAFCSHTK